MLVDQTRGHQGTCIFVWPSAQDRKDRQMHSWRWKFATAALIGGWGLLGVPVEDVRSEILVRRANVRCGIPSYCYGHDDPRIQASIVSIGPFVEEQVFQNFGLTRSNSANWPDPPRWDQAVSPAAESILSRPLALSADSPPIIEIIPPPRATSGPQVVVRRRRFVPGADALPVGFVVLDQIGLMIYETGEVACTGRITSIDGPDEVRRGGQITIRVRGYGTNREASPNVPNGPMFFETCQTIWVPRGTRSAISLVPVERCIQVSRHFDEITHLEVNLEHRFNR